MNCVNCGSDKTYFDKRGKGRYMWYYPNNKPCCRKCYDKLFNHPKNGPKRISFKDKRITLDKNPRTGMCSQCGFIGKTHIHHEQYDESDPLKHTIELCISCHSKEGHRLGQLYTITSTNQCIIRP